MYVYARGFVWWQFNFFLCKPLFSPHWGETNTFFGDSLATFGFFFAFRSHSMSFYEDILSTFMTMSTYTCLVIIECSRIWELGVWMMFASFLFVVVVFCLVQMAIRDSVGVNFYGYICGVWPVFSFRPSSVFVANKNKWGINLLRHLPGAQLADIVCKCLCYPVGQDSNNSM